MTDHEGNTYKTKQIDSLIWTIENFRATTCKDGKNLNFALESIDVKKAFSKEIPSICYDAWDYFYRNTKPRNRPENFEEGEYGYLYNGFVVLNAKELILPDGWRIPTIEDYQNLYETTGKTSYKAAAALRTGKPISIAFKDPLEANNSSGFSAMARGGRREDGILMSKSEPIFWTSSENNYFSNDKRFEYVMFPSSNESFRSVIPSLLGAFMNLRFVKE